MTIFKISPFKVTSAVRVVVSSEKQINQNAYLKKRLSDEEEIPIT